MLDHAGQSARRSQISGGGRCNFTNIHCRPENFLSENPHFAKSALARFLPADIIAMKGRRARISYLPKKPSDRLFSATARARVRNDARTHDHANMYQGAHTSSAHEFYSVSFEREHFIVVQTAETSFTADWWNSATLGDTARSRRWEPQRSATLSPNSSASASCPPEPGLVPLVFQSRKTANSGATSRASHGHRNRRSPEETLAASGRKCAGDASPGDELVPRSCRASSYWRPGREYARSCTPAPEIMAPLLTRNTRRDAATAGSRACARCCRTVWRSDGS